MQLVAYGAQDIYLTGNPQITFFKVVYRRHTNFSMEAIEQTFNGNVAAGQRVSATISRNGDLVHRMYLAAKDSASHNYTNYANPGHFSLIDTVELEIGGQRIDKHSAQWMETWAQLTEPNPTGAHDAVSNDMAAGNPTKFQKMAAAGGCAGAATTEIGLVHVPLQFWFCRNPGLALPLIALQYHEVKVILTCATDMNYWTTSSVQLWADYIYLDTDERRRFAQVSHEYLIEQVQEESATNGATEKSLNFNHPVKELVISGNPIASGSSSGGLLRAPYTGDTAVGLKLNGHERFAPRDYKYFTRAQVWQHHTGYGGVDATDTIAVYSFALKPEEHQPSGTCNFSRIDNAVLTGVFAVDAKIYAVNYNVLRIMSGMGGLAYSN